MLTMNFFFFKIGHELEKRHLSAQGSHHYRIYGGLDVHSLNCACKETISVFWTGKTRHREATLLLHQGPYENNCAKCHCFKILELIENFG